MRFKTIFILAACLSAGCATHEQRVLNVSKPATTSTAHLDPSANLSLDEILPKPVLGVAEEDAATQRATTQATAKPPLDAIALFAQAREAMLGGQRYTAINLLEKAIALDPHSYQLDFALGQANTGPGMSYDPAIKAYEAAAAIEPDHLAVHGELGRLYLAKGNLTRAIQHLRLAMQTQDYDEDTSHAAVVDLLLAKALQQAGYDRASLDCYTHLIERLENGGVQTRGNPELAYLISQPEGLFIEVGSLFEKRGDFDDAIHLYSLAAEHKPGDFSYQAHLVHALAAAGKADEATKRATQLVEQFHASPESLTLLKDTYRKSGGDQAVVREFTRLHKENPSDRTILYALVDVLNDTHRSAEAQSMLADAVAQAKYPTDMVRRLFKMYDSAGDTDAAARLVITSLAARPDSARELLPMWGELLRPWRKNHLTVSRLETLDVPAWAQASKEFWLSQLARIWGREILARTSLEQAVKQVPPFAPAYRGLLGQYFARDDWDEAQKTQASQALIDSVEKQGDSLLAFELRGLLLLSTKHPDQAAKEFAKAIEQGDPSSDLRLSYATALQASGDSPKAQQVLWKLIGDDSSCEDAYIELFKIYLDAQQGDQAVKVLNTWLKNEPTSTNARLLEAQASPPADAKQILDDLFEREPDNLDVLASMGQLYNQTGKIDDYIAKLEAQRTAHPENRAVLEQLIQIYASRKDIAPATRALDATRAAAGQDADLLYYVASLYSRIDQKDTAEQVLEQVIKIDPTHAAACNDLGYSWADAGKNLNHAESLIRIAVAAEPDNQSFLDSLGWVLYKLGKFDPAKQALDEAIGTSSLPDAVVLNHLGDTEYRLNQSAEAAKTWKRSQARIAASNAAGDDRDELKQLRLELQAKLKQLESGAPVSVAPTGQEPAKQAKNN